MVPINLSMLCALSCFVLFSGKGPFTNINVSSGHHLSYFSSTTVKCLLQIFESVASCDHFLGAKAVTGSKPSINTQQATFQSCGVQRVNESLSNDARFSKSKPFRTCMSGRLGAGRYPAVAAPLCSMAKGCQTVRSAHLNFCRSLTRPPSFPPYFQYVVNGMLLDQTWSLSGIQRWAHPTSTVDVVIF